VAFHLFSAENAQKKKKTKKRKKECAIPDLEKEFFAFTFFFFFFLLFLFTSFKLFASRLLCSSHLFSIFLSFSALSAFNFLNIIPSLFPHRFPPLPPSESS